MKSSVNSVEVFFDLIKAGLWENSQKYSAEVLEFRNSVDWEEVYRLASEQSVLGLALAGIDFLPSNQRPPKVELLQWIGEIQMLEQQNKEMNAFIGELVDNMRKEGIYALLLKGQGVAQCYEKPLWRSCGDVDFLLSDDNYESAKKYLEPLATSVKTEVQYEKQLGMNIDPWLVELHGYLRSGLSRRVDRVLDAVQNDIFCGGDARSWMNENTQVFLPGYNSDAVYIFTHILQHFYKGGIGLRQICDWSRFLWKFHDKINFTLLEKRIKEAGLMSEWKAFGAFAVDYLGMPSEAMPFYSPDAKWSRKAKRISKFIIKVGNFGHNRDMSYFENKPYLIRKFITLGRRMGDLISHARIFPLDSLRFFPTLMVNGVVSAVRGE